MAEVDLGKGYHLWDFDRLPDEPGMYSWHLVHSALGPGTVEDYYKFIKTKEFSIELKANLREVFEGTVRSQENLKPVEIKNVNEELFEAISKIFSPSIYIGIARKQSLKTRLNQHKKLLQHLLNGGSPANSSESSFANRVFKIVDKRSMTLDENNFFVRIYDVDLSLINPKDIQDTETFVNRTYHPQLGKR